MAVALIRLWGSDSIRTSPDPAPSDELIARVRRAIMDRVNAVDRSEAVATEKTFDEFLSEWRRVPPSRYGSFGPLQDTVPLMFPAGSQESPEWDGKAQSTPSSMRNVDATCNAQAISSYPEV